MASEPIPQPGSTPEPDFGIKSRPVVPTPLPRATGGVPAEPLPAIGSTPGADPGAAPDPAALRSVTHLISPAGQTDLGLTSNLAALVSMILPPFTSLAFLFLEKRNSFVRFWATQGLLFGCAVVVIHIVLAVIAFVIAHGLLLGGLMFLFSSAVNLVLLALWIVMMVKAYMGQEWEAPVIGQMARQQLNKGPMA